MYFSKATGGFYDSAIHGQNIPADAVELTLDAHAALLAEQSIGKIITADASGNPIASDPPPPTAAQLWATYQAQASTTLTRSDITILRCAENAVAVPAAWATYRAALRAIISAASGDASVPLPTRPSYPAAT